MIWSYTAMWARRAWQKHLSQEKKTLCCYQTRYFSYSYNNLRPKKNFQSRCFGWCSPPLIRWTPSKYNPLRSVEVLVLFYPFSYTCPASERRKCTTKPRPLNLTLTHHHHRWITCVHSFEASKPAQWLMMKRFTKQRNRHIHHLHQPQLLRSQVPNRFLLPALHTLRLTWADSIDLIQ